MEFFLWQIFGSLLTLRFLLRPLISLIIFSYYISSNSNWTCMIYFLFILIASIFPNEARQDNSFIDWNPKRKLSWSDFKAPPDKAISAAALTSTDIKFDAGFENNSFKFHIHCMFVKNKSWGRVKNDYILQHEQGHFDIAEIYARKLNKILKSYKPQGNNPGKDVSKIYENIMQGYNEEQDLYDKETEFSKNHSKQEEWLRKIDGGLTELQDYANYN